MQKTAIMGYSDTDKLAINTIRVLAVRDTPPPPSAGSTPRDEILTVDTGRCHGPC